MCHVNTDHLAGTRHRAVVRFLFPFIRKATFCFNAFSRKTTQHRLPRRPLFLLSPRINGETSPRPCLNRVNLGHCLNNRNNTTTSPDVCRLSRCAAHKVGAIMKRENDPRGPAGLAYIKYPSNGDPDGERVFGRIDTPVRYPVDLRFPRARRVLRIRGELRNARRRGKKRKAG